MKRRWKDNRIKEEQERRGKDVLYDKSLKKCSSLLLIKEKYTSEPLASKNRIKFSKTLNISLITQMGAAYVHSASLDEQPREKVIGCLYGERTEEINDLTPDKGGYCR